MLFQASWWGLVRAVGLPIRYQFSGPEEQIPCLVIV
jgi:hypothetical protein